MKGNYLLSTEWIKRGGINDLKTWREKNANRAIKLLTIQDKT